MMIFIDYPNGCIMEISCIIDSVLKPTDFLPSKLLVSTEKKKSSIDFKPHFNESGGGQRGSLLPPPV